MSHTMLHDGIAASDPPAPLPTYPAIAGEIAARILEASEKGRDSDLGYTLQAYAAASKSHPHQKHRGISEEGHALLGELSQEGGAERTRHLFTRLAQCHTRSLLATKWMLHILSGDISPVVEPFAAQGRKAAKTKQAAHKEYLVAQQTITELWPEVAHVLLAVRESYRLHH